MTYLMGGPVVDVVSTDNTFVALLEDFLVGVPTSKGNAKGDNSNLWGWPKDSWRVMLLMLRGFRSTMGKSVRCGRSSEKWIRKGLGHGGFVGYLSSAGAGHIENSELVDVMSSSTAFAAITRNSPVLVWGDRGNGGKITDNVDLHTKEVEQLIASESVFLALKTDGTLVTCGNASAGGEIPRGFRDELTGIEHIHAANHGFVAISVEDIFSRVSSYFNNRKLNLP